ncbi:MAG: DUF58 domain-containing protein [Bifidobacteriaceae bacterium]|nr:DUF58 domain-containing protein [Bifidobacteriaceae bacterium]
MLAPVPLTVLVWTALVVLLAGIDLVLAVSPNTLRLERGHLGSIRLTEAATSVLTVVNSAERKARLHLRDAWATSAGVDRELHRLELPPGEARRTEGQLRPVRCGDFTADRVTVRSFGPLGLAGRQRSFEVPGRLRVLPEFRSRRHLPSRLARLREMDGRTAAQVRGQGTEFDSLREYALGDDVRSIDWRASARSEHVVVRTWRPERDRRVLIVLDTSRWAAGRVGDQTRLEAGIEAALLLGALASAGGDRVELLAIDRAVQAVAVPTVGSSTMATLSDQLAVVEPALVEANWKLIAAQINSRLRRRALVVLATSTDPALVEVGLAPVLETLLRRHVVMVATVRDPSDTERLSRRNDIGEVFQAAAAERRGLAVTAMEKHLRSMGTQVVAALPESLAPAVADSYLALKTAGQL